MRNKMGNIFMALGIALVLSALSLFLLNVYKAHEADESTKNILPKIIDHIPNEVPKKYSMEMRKVKIEDNYYIGYINFPYAGLKLPVMSDWSYTKLNIAPCRYYGSDKEHNLVIAGHNFTRHFGVLSRTSIGDIITFTDMDGITNVYKVLAIDILLPNAVEEMINGEYDLTLFTCTYGGKNRITIRCDQVYNN